MYDPVKDGVRKSARSVVYVEASPPAWLEHVVHCFWELRTTDQLDDDFVLHAVPDACVNLLFNQLDPRIAGVTQLHTSHAALDLGRTFHYCGVQFFPGVWCGNPDDSVDHFVGERYEGPLPLIEVGRAAADRDFDGKVAVFGELVAELLALGVVAPNPVTAAILANLDDIHTVADMARHAALSPRQLQRTLQRTTGFTPHDLLKVLRIQHAFRRDYLLTFADQSHYTHSFRQIVGLPPGEFKRTFDV